MAVISCRARLLSARSLAPPKLNRVINHNGLGLEFTFHPPLTPHSSMSKCPPAGQNGRQKIILPSSNLPLLDRNFPTVSENVPRVALFFKLTRCGAHHSWLWSIFGAHNRKLSESPPIRGKPASHWENIVLNPSRDFPSSPSDFLVLGKYLITKPNGFYHSSSSAHILLVRNVPTLIPRDVLAWINIKIASSHPCMEVSVVDDPKWWYHSLSIVIPSPLPCHVLC